MNLNQRVDRAAAELSRWRPDIVGVAAELIASNILLKAAPELFPLPTAQEPEASP